MFGLLNCSCCQDVCVSCLTSATDLHSMEAFFFFFLQVDQLNLNSYLICLVTINMHVIMRMKVLIYWFHKSYQKYHRSHKKLLITTNNNNRNISMSTYDSTDGCSNSCEGNVNHFDSNRILRLIIVVLVMFITIV